MKKIEIYLYKKMADLQNYIVNLEEQVKVDTTKSEELEQAKDELEMVKDDLEEAK